MKDMDTILHNPSYKELQDTYLRYFSLGGITGEIDNKFALISLICFLTHQAKQKNPDASCYQVIKKVTEGRNSLPEDYIIGLSIICEDFLKGSSEFNKCGCKSVKEMIEQINNILDHWLPF